MSGPLKPSLPGRKWKVAAPLPPIPVWETPTLGTQADPFFAVGYRRYATREHGPIPIEVFPADTPEKRLLVHGIVAASVDRIALVNKAPGACYDVDAAWLRLLEEKRAEQKRQREVKAAAEASAAAPTFGQMAAAAGPKR